MKLLISVTCFLLFQKNVAPINTYCNSRFKYCINYPEFLFPQRESENGDGKVFKNEKGESILTVYGRLNQDLDGNPITLKKEYDQDIEVLKSAMSNITYRKMGKNFYVLSGLKYNKVFYRKVIIKGTAFCYATIEYEESEKRTYDKVSTSIFKSFN